MHRWHLTSYLGPVCGADSEYWASVSPRLWPLTPPQPPLAIPHVGLLASHLRLPGVWLCGHVWPWVKSHTTWALAYLAAAKGPREATGPKREHIPWGEL